MQYISLSRRFFKRSSSSKILRSQCLSVAASRFDRSFWLAMLLTAAVVIPRSLSIAHAHSESYDDHYHLSHGLVRLTRERFKTTYNDPPFGETVLALPLWVTGCALEASKNDSSVIAHHSAPDA